MKRILLQILLTFFAITLFSQENNFPTEDADWTFIKRGDLGFFESSTDYHLFGDTIIGNNTYQQIEGPMTDGFIRSEDQKVYFFPQDSTQEYLLYDFNLEEGDAFVTQWSWGNPALSIDTIYVSNVDSVMTDFGYRKRWRFDNLEGEWIEGIGSTWSVTNPAYISSLSGSYSLLCFVNEGELHYGGPTTVIVDYAEITVDCSGIIVSLMEPENDISSVILSPNPCYNKLSILFPEVPSETMVEIFDRDGNLVKSFESVENILLEDLNTGVYFIRFEWKNKLQIGKIVKL